ncbi:MAG: Rrf2 family transcriptional regulator [Draconibacterium sp.]|nr:Rrf2 family transcriptional regulator [Draconibacterium sp.]
MNLSKTTKYAFRILGHMAKDEKVLYSAQQLHKDIDIPERYLRRLLTDLSKSGFIKSIQGRQGGFTFARDTSKITLMEIVDSIDGKDSIDGCILGYDVCVFNYSCPMHNVWEETKQKTIDTLTKTSLKDINNHPHDVF